MEEEPKIAQRQGVGSWEEVGGGGGGERGRGVAMIRIRFVVAFSPYLCLL